MLAFLLVLAGCGKRHTDSRPLSPQQELQSFRLSEDFRVELFASEPHVVDPVEMVFDENGRIYVAEMLDYPEDPPPGKPARSRIKMLEDSNGDGRIDGADRVVVFADQVLEVSGLLPWKGGLIVTSAPDILFMKDTDGDGKADLRKVLYTGFPKVNPEGRITNPRYAIDNWIYAANNGADGKITSPEHPERPPILVRGTDFRFRPDRGLAEVASGPAQFGLTFDDWGNRYITHNTIHLRHVVVPMQYLGRAPLLAVPAVSYDISDHGRPSARMFQISQPQVWRVERSRIRQHRHDENEPGRIEQVSGYFTAAAGSTVYNGDVFPAEYWGNVFTGDVAGNLVHRDILHPDGVTFRASRAKDGVEFLATTDIWFRPCTFANAPDGNLYMMDMYREFIETPESIPEAIKKTMNYWSGDDKGRIYRIVPNKPLRKRDLKSNLGAATTTLLVQHLSSTNGWHRTTAQRLLVDRQDRSAIPLLTELAEKSDSPQARLHALWTLEGLSALEPTLVLRALKDPHPALREHALRLTEEFLTKPRESPAPKKSKPMAEAVLAMTKDPEPRVQFQLALTLGQFSGARNDRRVLNALADIASKHAADRWFRIAILSSAHDSASELFHLLRARGDALENADFLNQLAALIGARHEPAEIARFFSALSQIKKPEAALAGLARGLKLVGVSGLRVPGAEAVLMRFLNSALTEVNEAAWEAARYFELRGLVPMATEGALSPNLPVTKRAAAVRALRGASFSAVEPVLRKILESHAPPELQVAAVESLAAFDDPAVGRALLAHWRSYSPEARQKALNALLNHRARVSVLLQAVAEGQIEPAALDVAARARLLENPDREIAGRARRLFQGDSSDRAKVVESFRDALKLAGDVDRGKKVFEKECAKCHTPRRFAGRVGPDLSGINNKTREELLTSILNPSYAIEARYTNYLVTTRNGRLYDGVIASETPHAITLRSGSGEGDETILRKNIAEIRASRISLMPDEVEKSLSRQAVADLIAYLRGGL